MVKAKAKAKIPPEHRPALYGKQNQSWTTTPDSNATETSQVNTFFSKTWLWMDGRSNAARER